MKLRLQPSLTRSEVVPISAQPLPGQAVPAATPSIAAPPTGYPARHGGSRRNGRLGVAVPDGIWELAWEAPLDPAFPPRAVLQVGDRILVEAGAWLLLDRQGEQVARGRQGKGVMTLDAPIGLLFGVDLSGSVVAYRLTDGEQAFRTFSRGPGFHRALIVREVRRLLAVSFDVQQDPHGGAPPSRSTIQAIGLGDPLEVDERGSLGSQEDLGTLHIDSASVLAAAPDDGSLVVAVPDHLLILGSNSLKVEAAFSGSFHPLGLSLDEAGNVHLVVRREAGLSLWVISSRGERLLSVDLTEVPAAPPLIALDHTIFLAAPNELRAIGRDGATLWTRRPARLGGASVAPDAVLLTSEGNHVVAHDRAGEARQVLTTRDPLLTAPVLTDRGELLLASRGRVACFRVSP